MGNTLLGVCLSRSLWLRGQLKYRCLLTHTHVCQQNGLPIGEFERIMMDPRCMRVHLPEDCRRVTNPSRPPKGESGCPNCYRARKRKFSSRKNAHRYCGIFCRSEPTCAGTEITCGEFVADLCWP